jgi:hypothetical protein
VPKKLVSQDRKARIAEMQQQEKARENRVRLMIVAGCVAILLAIGGAIAFAIIRAPSNKPDAAMSAVGVPASAASCDPVTNDKAAGQGSHADPAKTPKLKYDTVPPSTGPHFAQPAVSDRKFYTAADRPKIEVLVHNLEHGYTVLWYDQAAGEAKAAELQKLADLANKTDASLDKFIVSAWDPSYGALPAGKKFALSHWSATLGPDGKILTQEGHRQLCGALSGEVVKTFIEANPRTSAPEPAAA